MNITEKAQWEESVTLLTRQQKVEGGQDGAANIQAKELANRTAWLKSQVESIPDYREYTFHTSDDDPDGTITGLAGTPVGKIFRVALYDGQGQSVAFRYYLNNNGAASFLNEIPSSRAIGDLTSVDSMLLTGLSQLVVSVVRVTEDLDAIKISDASQTLNNANLLEAVSVQSKALAAISPTVEGNTENLSVKSASLEAFSALYYQLSKLEGFDINAAGSVVQPTVGSVYSVGAPAGIVKISATMPRVPGKKEDEPERGYSSINVDGQIIHLPTEFSVQGASSAGYAKKNLNFDFYTTIDYDESASVKIGSIIPHDTLVFKANWIDSTHVRNLLSYRLWDKFMLSRKQTPQRDVDHSYDDLSGVASYPTGALGMPTGWPCVVYINDSFYGIGSLMIGKKRENYNLPKNVEKKIFLGFDSWVNPRALIKTDESGVKSLAGGLDLKTPSKPTQETYKSIELFSNALSSSTADELKSVMGKQLDLVNMIDFHLFTAFIATTDLINPQGEMKNVIVVSWGDDKFYFMPYDLDTVFGVGWAGNALYPTPGNIYVDAPYMQILHSTYKAEVESRYKQLRDEGIISADNIYKMAMEIMDKYSPELIQMENARWTTPSVNITSLSQILTWVKGRIAFLDTRFNYK
ncbi:CotH kinase family protein [Pluralibacter gergoviae]|uniref:CotH kinase family protein n=1 Tax=Pluralibacter gergoviae TaxID=61647 RepID=UPI0006ABF4BD|nr:CotH kinase family protein [Pluralibacter gergoviae]